jgi:YD repeat-containing protein
MWRFSEQSVEAVMVAIVSGNSLGLSLSSLTTLGQRGLVGSAGQGRSGELAYVNAATGNLVLQNRDEFLLGRGPDVLSVRTYNSQGLLDDDNADNWSVGAFGQKVALTGTVATVGSTLTRTDRDGAQAVYAWDAASGRYVSTAGAGAFDTIAYDDSALQFVWTDGDSGLSERYQAAGQGRLVSATDADGNTVSYAYNANGTVQSLTDASGEVTWYDYTGNQLTRIRSVDASGASLTHVQYGYDASGRLSTVTVDLSPEDGSIADSRTYVTTYTYDGASNRVASVAQSDGTTLAFTYVQSGGTYKVASVTDALGAVTRFSYDAGQGATTVTDPLGAQSVYSYDAQGQLLQLRQGVTANHAGGVSQVSYAYDATGNVTRVTDGEGHKVDFTYDERGNLLKEVDSAGDTRVRTYGAQNQLLTDTVYADAATSAQAAALPETARYVYAQGNPRQLRFAISAQGSVTEYRYDAYGQRTVAVEYRGAAYDAAGLALDAVPGEAQMVTWQQAQNLAQTLRTDYAYDGRGALSSSTVYAEIGADGQGVAASAATTQYIYDPRGLLLQKIEPGDVAAVTNYIYDGLGRVLSASGPSLDGGATPNTTVTSYDDANGKVTVAIASGLITTSAYDLAGRLVSVTQQSAGTGVLGTTSYVYDKDGNLLMTQDPTGVRKWMLYDEADRKIADVDATGAVIEYAYNANGQLRQTIAYTGRIDTALLVDGAGLPTTAWSVANTTTSLAALRPASASQDQKVWNFYDDANRLAFQVDGLGYVTQTVYDGASRVLSTTKLANPVDVRLLEPQEGTGVSGPPLPPPNGTAPVDLQTHSQGRPDAPAIGVSGSVSDATYSLTGTYSVFEGQTLLGVLAPGSSSNNFLAALDLGRLSGGTHTLTVVYSGDAYYASATRTQEITVAPAESSVALGLSPNQAQVEQGTPVTLTATVGFGPYYAVSTNYPGGVAPGGTVTFYNNGTAIGTAQVINGVATFTLNDLPLGRANFSTAYSGDASYTAVAMSRGVLIVENARSVLNVVAAQATESSATLAANSATVQWGSPLTLVATLTSGGVPVSGGTVTFYKNDGWVAYGPVAVVNGQASISIDTHDLPVSNQRFFAVYSGDEHSATAMSGYWDSVVSIEKAATTTTLSSSAASVAEGETLTITAQVAGQDGGLVTFFNGTTSLGVATVVNGQASLAINTLAEGTYSIRATYTGTSNSIASTTTQDLSVQVTQGAEPVTPLQPLGTAELSYFSFYAYGGFTLGGQSTLYVSGAGSDAVHPLSGSFSFFDGQTLLGSVPAASAGAGFVLSLSSVGARTLTVVYSGDAYYASATRTQEITVAPAESSVALGLSPNQAQVEQGTPVTLTATVGFGPYYAVSTNYPGGVAPGGTVTFYNNGTAIGTAQVINGVATFTLNDLPLGRANFSTAYSGDASYTAVAMSRGVLIVENARSVLNVVAAQATESSATLAANSATVQWGSPLTLVATLTSGGVPVSGGTVTFYKNDGWVAYGPVAVVNGQASISIDTHDLPVSNQRFFAVYSGDEHSATAMSGYWDSVVSIEKAATTTTLSSSAASVAEGETLTITAQVAGQDGGLVTFFNGTTSLGVATVVNGQASLAINTLAEGTYSIRATYTGTSNSIASTTTQDLSVQVTQGAEPVTPLQPLGTAELSYFSFYAYGGFTLGGQSTLYVSGAGSDAVHPLSGSFSFFDGQTLLGSVPAASAGAGFVLSLSSVGARTLTVVYSGDAYYASATRTQEITVAPAESSVALGLSPNQAQVEQGTPVTLTATVGFGPYYAVSTNYPGGVAPGGTVTFYNNGTAIGTAQVINGIATLTLNDLPLGRANFSTAYSGDASYTAVAMNRGVLIVENARSVLNVVAAQATESSATLAANSATVQWGSPLTLVATLTSGGVPVSGGTVTFYKNDGWVAYGPVAVVNGQASISIDTHDLPVSNQRFFAVYSGDEHSATAMSGYWDSVVSIVGEQPASPAGTTTTSITLTSSAASVVQGETLTLIAQVSGNNPGGLVTFYNGATVLGTASVVNGQASLQINTLGADNYAITAAYVGDANNLSSIAAQALGVHIATPSVLPRLGLDGLGTIPVTLQVDDRPVPIGTAVTLTASIGAAGSDGMVTFFSGNTVLGSAPVIDGKAVLLTRELPVGVNSITASYVNGTQGGTHPSASLSSSVQKVVTRVVPDSTLRVSPKSLGYGEGVTLTMALTDDASMGFAFATGEVRFYNGNTLLGTANVIQGVATLTVGKLPAGDLRLRATYAGDAVHEISSAEAQTVVGLIPTQENLQVSGSGDFLDLRASVRSSPEASTPPSGLVVFYDGDVVIGQAMLVDGVALLRIAVPPSGQTALFRATYAGSIHHAASETPQDDGAYTAVALTASATQVAQGDAVSLTARVIGSAPQGVVSFFAGAQFLGSAQVVDGVATLVTSYLPQGSSVALSASYSGDDYNRAGNGNGPALGVSAGASSVSPPGMRTLNLEPHPAVVGDRILITASGQNFPAGQGFMVFEGQTFIGRGDWSSNGWILVPALPVGTHELTVVYDGDFPDNTAATGTVQVVVQPRDTELRLSSSGTPVLNEDTVLDAVKGAPLTFTAQVGLGWINAYTNLPSVGGVVTFYSDGVEIGTASVIQGRAMLTVSDLPLGMHRISASYSGDSNYESSTTSTGSLVVQRVVSSAQAAPSTVALSATPALLHLGTPSTLTASIGSSGGTSLPLSGGSVSFYDGDVLLGTADVIDGHATLAVALSNVGARTLRAVYSGDTARATSETQLEVTVEKAATTVATLTASATSVAQGQPVTLTAQVTGAAATGGLVSFFAGTQFLGTAAVVNGQASFVTYYLPVGSNIAINAAYGGDANATGSVIAQGVRISVAASSGNVQSPPAVDYRWGNNRAGQVGELVSVDLPGVQQQDGVVFSVFDGDVLVGNYTASYWSVWYGPTVRIPTLPVGVHQITVISTGGSATPVATTFQLGIYKATGRVDLITSPRSQAVAGEPLTLTARVTDYDAAIDAPIGGTVTFYRDGVIIGTADVIDGLATLTVSTLPLGESEIKAGYSGDANHSPSDPWWQTNLVVEVVASPVASAASLSAAKDLSLPGQPLVLTATLSGTGGPEAGTVSFYEGTTPLGTAPVVGSLARLVFDGLLAGAHSIRAVYTGDANNLGSSATAEITVVKTAAVLTNITASTVSANGELSVRVGRDNAGGLVSFYEGTHFLGVARVIDGVATLSGVELPSGTHAFTAAYTGDAYSADSELRFTQVVEGVATAIVYVQPDAAQDRTVTRLYNRNGQIQGVVDAEGYLTEYIYNAAGEQVRTVAYANRANGFADPAVRETAIAIARASGTLAGLRPGPSSDDVETHNLYDARGRLVGQIDGEGYLTETVYDIRGNVIQSIRYAGKAGVVGPAATLSGIRPGSQAQDQVIVQTWSAAGQLLSRTNAEGTVTRFAYDGIGQLVQTTTAEGTTDERTSSLRYDIQGRLIGQLDGRGSDAVAQNDPLAAWADNGLTHSYDAAGRRTSTTDANGHRTLFFYDPIGRLRFTVNAMGEVAESRYSSQGQLVEQVAYGTRVNVVTLGASTPGGLNTDVLSALLAGATEADAHVSYTYNATGTRASATDAVGSTTSYAYNAFREASVSSYALKNGTVVTDTASFDRRGLLIRSVKDAAELALVERTTYDAFGRAVERFDANGNRSEAGYDRLGRLIVTTDALGKERRTTYDAFNRVLAQMDALGHTTTYSYDTAQRRITLTTPEGVSSVTEHDRYGQTQRVTDGRGNVTTFTYDKSGNLLRTDAPEGVGASASYDKAGLKFDSTDANGVKTGYTYDAANRLLTRTLDPAGLNLITAYGYDALGRNISVTDARGVVTVTEFDLAGKTVRQVVDPEGLALVTSYIRDTTGNVLSVTDPNGNLTLYTYDGAGRRIQEVLDPLDPNAEIDPWSEELPPLNITRTYRYDANGNVVQSTDGNGKATNYTYDANNRLVYTLDAAGGVSQTFYDDEGRVVRAVRYATAISLEDLPPLPTATDIAILVATHATDMVQSRRYDRDGRLHFTVDGTGAVVEYTYDASNNLVETRAYSRRIDVATWSQDTDPPVVADASDERTRTVYDALNRAVWTVDGTGGVRRNIYDANGNVIDSRAYANALSGAAFDAWDGESAPVVSVDAARDQRVRTVFDAANRAVWQVDGAGGVVYNTYDAAGNVLERRAYANALEASALQAWDGQSPVQPQPDEASDQRIRRVFDAAGRVTWTVDGAGSVTSNEYDTNGNLILRTQFSHPVESGASPDSVEESDEDRHVRYIYNAANRVDYQSRWQGGWEPASPYGASDDDREEISYDYDGAGRLLRQTIHAEFPYGSQPDGGTDQADRSNYFVYDAAGRLTYSVNAEGAVTGNTYDGAGRLIRTRQFADAIESVTELTRQWWRGEPLMDRTLVGDNYEVIVRHLRVDAGLIETNIDANASLDRITSMVYDAAGRRTFTVDAMGGVSHNLYDAFGNVVRQIDYTHPVEQVVGLPRGGARRYRPAGSLAARCRC